LPIFEYRCAGCGTEFESVSLPGSGATARCPGCGGKDLKKLFSPFASPSSGYAARGATCCGREERCDAPPCDSGGCCGRR